jgi:hypothetical protein
MSIEFDTTAYITKSFTARLGRACSLDCWFKFDGWSGTGYTYRYLMDMYANSAIWYNRLRIRRDGDQIPPVYQLQYATKSIFGSEIVATNTTHLSTGTWYHGAGFWSTTNTLGVYLDGGGYASNTNSSTILSSAGNLYIGGVAGAASFDGLICEAVATLQSFLAKGIADAWTGISPPYRLYFGRGGYKNWLRGFSTSDLDMIDRGTYTYTNCSESEDHAPVLEYVQPVRYPRSVGAAPPVVTRQPRPGIYMGPGMVA